jgi:SnoaL-like domain
VTSTSLDLHSLHTRYVKTFASGNVDAILALHAVDTQFWLHTGRAPAVGRKQVATTFARFFEQWPNFGFETYRVLIGNDHWVLDWVMTASPISKSGTSSAVRFDCLDVVTVNSEGFVLRKDTFVDMVQLQQAMASLAA